VEKSMSKYLLIIPFILIQGCTTPSKIAVMTLDQTIQNAAEAAKKGSNGASKTINIKVGVTQGYTAGATIPVSVVPINVGVSSNVSTTLTMDVNLNEYTPPMQIASEPRESVFILDTRTGKLE
jgi:hypothetical protein